MAKQSRSERTVPAETSEGEDAQPSTAHEQSAAKPSSPHSSVIDIVGRGDETELREAIRSEIATVANTYVGDLADYCLLSLYDPHSSIGTWDADQIYRAIRTLNPTKNKNILLYLVSNGGSIESAYQISKLCRSFARERFVVVVPRRAKSAATLLALGADEIHMGYMSQLGPIDPQLDGLPALGVLQALRTITALAAGAPGSSDMLAAYLKSILTVEQIGYCERISESAVQYAERLLGSKPPLSDRAPEIARELVYEYKDHGFVIDIDEARSHLGDSWIITESPELAFAEAIYERLEFVNLLLDMMHKKELRVTGDLLNSIWIWKQPSR